MSKVCCKLVTVFLTLTLVACQAPAARDSETKDLAPPSAEEKTPTVEWTRVSFNCGENWSSLSPSSPLEADVAQAIRELLSKQATPKKSSTRSAAESIRIYDFSVDDSISVRLEEFAAGTIRAVVRDGTAEQAFETDLDWTSVRAIALKTLLLNTPPGVDLPGSCFSIALTRFLGWTSATATQRRRIWNHLVAKLTAESGSAQTRLAKSILQSPLSGLSEPHRAALLAADSIDAKVVAFTQLAQKGDAHALRELVVLALEYHAKRALFDQALRVLAPADLNPTLHRLYPPNDPGAFLNALRADFERATFQKGTGDSPEAGAWTIEGEES